MNKNRNVKPQKLQLTKQHPLPPEVFEIPDWPGPGEIDLNIHDFPHKSSTTEWWYMHAHLPAADGKNYSLFASFFRKAVSYDKTKKEYNYAHSVLWALTDIENKKYYPTSLVDRDAPRIGLKRIKKGHGTKDPYFKRATIEMLKKGVVPYPDTLLKKDPVVPWNKLDLNYDGQLFKKLADGSYQLCLNNKRLDIQLELNFQPKMKPVRHGDHGVIENSAVEDFFYYFIPHCEVKGYVKLKKDKSEIKAGKGWYDHEFGAKPPSKDTKENEDIAWNWIGLQLDNGFQLTVYDVHTKDTERGKGIHLIMIDSKGQKHKTTDFKFQPYGERWTSTRTFNRYPVKWKVTSEEFQLDLEISTIVDDQEFSTVVSKPAFWEGRIEITGTQKGKKVSGRGYLERHGHLETDTIELFLKSVSRTTLASVRKVLPSNPQKEKLEELVSVKGNTRLLKNTDSDIYKKKLIAPIREITDRGGKSWRSYTTLACADAVGGYSQEAIDWMALPELMHVGSLIIDDVQDKSTIRRGGPTAHIVHGEALAINSGSAAYFIGQSCIYYGQQPDEMKVKIYNCYFETMRASHSGQAFDINGLDYLMPRALKNDVLAKKLPLMVLAIHRLKSGAPAGYLAKIGALLGKGTEEQIFALAHFFETLGVSFQVIDDTLNLKGFKDNLKTKAEDLTAGKITYPVALAMSKMPRSDRAKLWNIIRAKTDDIKELNKAITLINKYDAINQSERFARLNLERAWKKLDPLIEDTMVKISIRAFSWYVLERTY